LPAPNQPTSNALASSRNGVDARGAATLVDKWISTRLDQAAKVNASLADRLEHFSKVEAGLQQLMSSLRGGVEAARGVLGEIDTAKESAGEAAQQKLTDAENQLSHLMNQLDEKSQTVQLVEQEARSRVEELTTQAQQLTQPVADEVANIVAHARDTTSEILSQIPARTRGFLDQFSAQLEMAMRQAQSDKEDNLVDLRQRVRDIVEQADDMISQSVKSAAEMHVKQAMESAVKRLADERVAFDFQMKRSLEQSSGQALKITHELDERVRQSLTSVRLLKSAVERTIQEAMTSGKSQMDSLAELSQQSLRSAQAEHRRLLEEQMTELDAYFSGRLLETQSSMAQTTRQFEASADQMAKDFLKTMRERFDQTQQQIELDRLRLAEQAREAVEPATRVIKEQQAVLAQSIDAARQRLEAHVVSSVKQMTSDGAILLEQIETQLQSKVDSMIKRTSESGRLAIDELKQTHHRLETAADLTLKRVESRMQRRLGDLLAGEGPGQKTMTTTTLTAPPTPDSQAA